MVVFGKPKVAMFTHIDSVGFMGLLHELFDQYLNGAKYENVSTKLKRKGEVNVSKKIITPQKFDLFTNGKKTKKL